MSKNDNCVLSIVHEAEPISEISFRKLIYYATCWFSFCSVVELFSLCEEDICIIGLKPSSYLISIPKAKALGNFNIAHNTFLFYLR